MDMGERSSKYYLISEYDKTEKRDFFHANLTLDVIKVKLGRKSLT
jgi:hypothetical protein